MSASHAEADGNPGVVPKCNLLGSREKPAAYIISFFGTHPRITQVPPTRSASAMSTRAPWAAARREAATPPEPAPMTIRSKSSVKTVSLGKVKTGATVLYATQAHDDRSPL